MKAPTSAQAAAIAARGNVLLEAGAGAGKTSTMVARCLDRLLDPADPLSLDEVLMVTFTEAAAAEMRRRIRDELTVRAAGDPGNHRLAEQLALLDQARIGTLHGFCLRLVRDHFHELGLDPQSEVLDEVAAGLLAQECAHDLLDRRFETAAEGSAFLEFVRQYGGGEARRIERLVVNCHRHLQTLPEPAAWLEREAQVWARFDDATWATALRDEFVAAIPDWCEQLAAQPDDNVVARQCLDRLLKVGANPGRPQIADLCRQLAAFRADEHWHRNKGRHRDPIVNVLDAAAGFAWFATPLGDGTDPMAADFRRIQPHALALLELVREFGQEYTASKRQRAVLDFSDLEQLALGLLWDAGARNVTAVAWAWRAQLREVYVDEYQDINEVQDRILAALSREGPVANRFLVGDVKQSIYGFRLARPDIFVRYIREWQAVGAPGQVLPLAENFRSHEAILDFVNACFAGLLREDLGGVGYPPASRLRFGDAAGRAPQSRATDPRPRVELHLLQPPARDREQPLDDAGAGPDVEEVTQVENEARHVARELQRMKAAGAPVFDRRRGFRPVDWGDIAILLRGVRGSTEVYARVFAQAGIPLVAERRGFFEEIEITDLLSLFQLLDNPQQDLPLLAVLRSPLVGLTPDDLVAVRLAAPREPLFWTALRRHQQMAAAMPTPAFGLIDRFLRALERWREQVRRGSLSQCLEDVLDATHYLAWLAAQPRGQLRLDNVQKLLTLTRQYDAWQGRGLHRFLEYVRLMDAEESGLEPATPRADHAVRLMTIHASKGLEFPVVVLAGLHKRFRDDTPDAGFLIDDELGLCATVIEETGRFLSLNLQRARRRQRQRRIAEEIRLLYVAMTRACDRLLLFGAASPKRLQEKWSADSAVLLSRLQITTARSPLDLLGPLLSGLCRNNDWHTMPEGNSDLLAWRIVPGGAAPAMPATRPGAESVPAAASASPVVRPDFSLISYRYPFLHMTRRAGKTTVTRLRRQLADEDDESQPFSGPDQLPPRRPSTGALSGAAIGVAHHVFLQRIELDAELSVPRLAGEADRLVQAGWLSAAERQVLDLDRIARFWAGEIGCAIRARHAEVRRELEFTAAFPVAELDALTDVQQGGDGAAATVADRVIVQGVVDLVVLGAREIWILDYKTDRVSAAELSARVRAYTPQVTLYCRALARVYRRPVTRVWLHFLHADVTIDASRPAAD